jgi:flagellar assembly factor FliW
LPGFEQCRRFVVLQSADLDPLVQLVGVDGSRPSFLALDPRRVIFDYDMELSPADRARLEAAADEVLLWLAIVRLDDRRLLVNLRAPIVINPRRMLGLQLVVANSPYDTQYVLPVD